MSPATRLWIYQRERFPLAVMAMLAGALTCASLSFSALGRGAPVFAHGWALAAAFASALMLFAQMRILDEFKDADDDRAFRPYRAVPRGLVTLRELGAIGVAIAVAQLALAASVDTRLAWLLAGVWGYLALMTAEFFVPEWLRARPLAYLASHVPVTGLIALYLTAFDWLPAGAPPTPVLCLWAASAIGTATLLEIGRKVRAPRDEERGVTTYSAVWGPKAAAAAWLAAFASTLSAASLAAGAIGLSSTFGTLVALLAVAALTCAARYARQPSRPRARLVEGLSSLTALALYAGVASFGALATATAGS